MDWLAVVLLASLAGTAMNRQLVHVLASLVVYQATGDALLATVGVSVALAAGVVLAPVRSIME